MSKYQRQTPRSPKLPYKDQFKPWVNQLDAIVLPVAEIDAIEKDDEFLSLLWAAKDVNKRLSFLFGIKLK